MSFLSRAILIFSVLLVGCFRRPDPFVPFGRELSRDELSKVVSTTFANSVSTYRALFSCSYMYGRKNYAFRQAIVIDNNKRVRLETFPEGALYSIALYQNDGLQGVLSLQDEREARFLPRTKLLMNKDLTLHLLPEDLLPLFSGSNFESESLNLKGFREGDKVTIIEGGGKKEWEIKGRTLTKFTTRDDNEKKALIFSVDEVGYEDNVLLPVALSVELPVNDILFSCRKIRIELNSEIRNQIFTPSFPDSWKIIDEKEK